MRSNKKTEDLPRISEIRETLRNGTIFVCVFVGGGIKIRGAISHKLQPNPTNEKSPPTQKNLRKSQKKKTFRFGEEIK